jgi:hypothetical protein
MKYICLGYFDEKKWEALSESEQDAYLDECFTFEIRTAENLAEMIRESERRGSITKGK